jgi:hypothetical protein
MFAQQHIFRNRHVESRIKLERIFTPRLTSRQTPFLLYDSVVFLLFGSTHFSKRLFCFDSSRFLIILPIYNLTSQF